MYVLPLQRKPVLLWNAWHLQKSKMNIKLKRRTRKLAVRIRSQTISSRAVKRKKATRSKIKRSTNHRKTPKKKRSISPGSMVGR